MHKKLLDFFQHIEFIIMTFYKQFYNQVGKNVEKDMAEFIIHELPIDTSPSDSHTVPHSAPSESAL